MQLQDAQCVRGQAAGVGGAQVGGMGAGVNKSSI